MARWPTFISIHIPESLAIPDLFTPDGTQWNADLVIHFFGDILGARVMAIASPISASADLRIWRSASLLKVVLSDLYSLSTQAPRRSLDLGWI